METEFVTGGSVPSFASEAEVDLSVVIPAYNEIDRLPGMLDECVECLKTAKKQTWVTGLLYWQYFISVESTEFGLRSIPYS